MEKRPSQKNILVAIFAVILVGVLAVSGVTLRNTITQQSQVQGAQIVNDQVFDLPVKLISGVDPEISYSMNANLDETLFSVIQRFDQNNDDFAIEYTEYEGMGAFITNFNSFPIDSNTQFWELSINGSSSLVGPSMYNVQKGDSIIFKLTSFN